MKIQGAFSVLRHNLRQKRKKNNRELPPQDKGKTAPLPLHRKGTGSTSESVQLRRTISLLNAIGICISNVIGSGIFISPQGVLKESGSVGLSLLIWFLCGLITLFGALSYSELGTLIHDSGGTYIYLLEGFSSDRKKEGARWKTIPAFLYNWQNTLFSKPAAMAIICLSCGEYLVRLSDPFCGYSTSFSSSTIAVKLIAAVVLCSVAVMNCYSVKFSTRIQSAFASIKIVTVSLVIIGGFWKFDETSIEIISSGFQGTHYSCGDIAAAFYSGLWAYNGWQNLNYVTEELKNPVRDLPRAIIPANLLVAVGFLLANASYLMVLGKDQLLESETVAVGFGYQVGGRIGEIIMIFLVAATSFGSASSGCFAAGRLSHVAAKEGHMMRVVSFIHKDYLSPTTAIIFNLVMGLFMITQSDIGSLIALNGFTVWLFIGAAQIALLIMRRTRKHEDRAFKVSIVIPVTVLLFSTFLVATPIVNNPSIGHFYVVGFLFLGLLAYIPFIHYQAVMPGTDRATIFIQKLLNVLPPDAPDVQTPSKDSVQ